MAAALNPRRGLVALAAVCLLAAGAITTLIFSYTATANSLNQTIEITPSASSGGNPGNSGQSRLLDFTATGAHSGIGSVTNPFTIYTNSSNLVLTALGPGTLTVTDDTGRVVYTFAKTGQSSATFNFSAPLDHGVGLYHFTATFTDSTNPNLVYGVRSLYISFLPTTPGGPDVPNTGIFYLGDRAFLTRDGLFSLACAALLAFLGYLIVSRKRRSKKSGSKKSRRW